MHPTPPMSPTLNLVTASPTARTRPMISCPGTHGYRVGFHDDHSSRAWWMSEWQIPQYSTSRSTSRGPTGRRWISSGPRGLVADAAP